jgi:DNA-directed RNA polymerase subunit RPC12/RpoP
MVSEKVAYEVTCLNCGRSVGLLEQSGEGGALRLRPAPYHDFAECELRAGTLRCTHCGGRAFVEGLSNRARQAPVAA